MTKLSNILKGLTSDELEELIEMAQHKTNELKAEKKVKLIGVYDGILALKYFKLEDKENAISYAHESFDKQLEDSKKKGSFSSEISIGQCLVPASEVNTYLEYK
ncbi:hypothetical protein [Gilliamella sp. Fer4-1]|jgi:hypothetical protein|uniref:hypothetical protein n=1 Tax=Gilliamella sp. Fer4-1 TaxID=3120242 RepID=UPI00080E145F|nr:hypothetical protein [Gilliamella apicola]OCG56850.1 hypothetical protein A9G30_02235 [Gilliamella apicola]